MPERSTLRRWHLPTLSRRAIAPRPPLAGRAGAHRAALLSSPARPVTDIAFACGFNNLSSFYRAIHAAFGLAPGELRTASRDARAA